MLLGEMGYLVPFEIRAMRVGMIELWIIVSHLGVAISSTFLSI